jgi:cytochrome c peroxidase
LQLLLTGSSNWVTYEEPWWFCIRPPRAAAKALCVFGMRWLAAAFVSSLSYRLDRSAGALLPLATNPTQLKAQLGATVATVKAVASHSCYAVTKTDDDMGCFKTPSLRNLANRGRYMHDGSFPTVKDALAHYIGGGNWNAHLDKEIHSLDTLTFDERDELLAFLDALNGKLPDNIGPPPDLVPTSHKPTTAK